MPAKKTPTNANAPSQKLPGDFVIKCQKSWEKGLKARKDEEFFPAGSDRGGGRLLGRSLNTLSISSTSTHSVSSNYNNQTDGDSQTNKNVLQKLGGESSPWAVIKGGVDLESFKVVLEEERLRQLHQEHKVLKIDDRDRETRETLLLNACCWGNVDIASWLISEGADINQIDSLQNRLTPLHIACRAGHATIVALLLASGAQINACDSSGDTALHWASRANHYTICKQILQAASHPDSIGLISEADVEATLLHRNDRGRTPKYVTKRDNLQFLFQRFEDAVEAGHGVLNVALGKSKEEYRAEQDEASASSSSHYADHNGLAAYFKESYKPAVTTAHYKNMGMVVM